MGGTWVHWSQPHFYREVARYGMKEQLKASWGQDSEADIFVNAVIDGETTKLGEQEKV